MHHANAQTINIHIPLPITCKISQQCKWVWIPSIEYRHQNHILFTHYNNIPWKIHCRNIEDCVFLCQIHFSKKNSKLIYTYYTHIHKIKKSELSISTSKRVSQSTPPKPLNFTDWFPKRDTSLSQDESHTDDKNIWVKLPILTRISFSPYVCNYLSYKYISIVQHKKNLSSLLCPNKPRNLTESSKNPNLIRTSPWSSEQGELAPSLTLLLQIYKLTTRTRRSRRRGRETKKETRRGYYMWVLLSSNFGTVVPFSFSFVHAW